MKYLTILIVFLHGLLYSQGQEKIEIKQLIDGFVKGNLAGVRSLVTSKNYYLKDSSAEKNSYTLVYVNKNKEGIGVEVSGKKLAILSYSVTNSETYNEVKDDLIKLKFIGDKPYQNPDYGIIEETGFVRNGVLVMSSNRKTKTGQILYDFVITKNF